MCRPRVGEAEESRTAAMPSLDPATRNIAIGRLQAGESQNEVARMLTRAPFPGYGIPTNWFNE